MTLDQAIQHITTISNDLLLKMISHTEIVVEQYEDRLQKFPGCPSCVHKQMEIVRGKLIRFEAEKTRRGI